MKKTLYILGTLVAFMVLATAIGAALPVKHRATRSGRFHQPPEAIWGAITEYQNFPAWRSSVKSVEPLPMHDGRPAWREIDSHGQALPFEIEEWQAPQRMVTRIAGTKLPFGGTWTYEIRPVEGGSELQITEDGEIYNSFFRFMARFVFGYTATMETYLRDLHKKYGESSEPQR